jgi:hypothetical protein
MLHMPAEHPAAVLVTHRNEEGCRAAVLRTTTRAVAEALAGHGSEANMTSAVVSRLAMMFIGEIGSRTFVDDAAPFYRRCSGYNGAISRGPPFSPVDVF